ncbi:MULTISPECIES: aminotransferase class I/II-fold pyridoxal phosphate-dependent enzyme [Staphylococcus]|jgi:putative aminotransferase A|uniref:aminotransferase class I/II-fold pyridoxal phosphate-dependent enzyme n=1 Tax=Staphylococcus TaxID=1279 RepID=UPI0001EF4C59|nr:MULTISPECIES: aminotransferase class I/II-fold pyridoxal phosphate-dependent enzyme [Staphylococcus]EFS17150.1 aminotransferase, class I [Staphylococcus capitis C87]MBC3048338.1 aminotransferase class I/II-fold pyridoxal phosphate-dependent enzyme [Staphylococcus capitis]MBC3068875.1 aminotransferase class I/II-fold pyridoxal phosphate-dependent enzyme [Staphylococcus capitis]MBC3071061.1 aminotransferase class I/II-fold pyridoxal phosphate-dependent enzyme [Staphylococcus capitis]MBC308143
MKLSLNTNSKFLRAPSIRQFSNRMKHIDDCVNLTIGQPDFPMPDVVKEAYISAIKEDKTSYSHNKGLPETRQAISNYFKKKYGFEYSEEEIIITNGASEALDTSLRSMIEPGDEILIPGPVYAGYIPLIETLGGTPIYMDTTQSEFKVTPELINSHITEKTKAILLNYPTNPTGVILERSEVKAIVNTLVDKHLFIISDEIYAENTFKGTHTSFAEFTEIRDQLLLIGGLSKSHSATGIRIGFLIGPEYLIEKLTFMHAYNCICANVPAQIACIAALNEGLEAPQYMNDAYIKRRDYLKNKLESLGFELTAQPEGAFYIFPSIKKFTENDFDFCVDVLEQAHVAMVPGSSFTDMGKGYIRISYAYEMDMLKEGMRRLENYLNQNYPDKMK